ncbi:hypothetical protein KAM621c_54330 (plasmid) [Citrobacter braakii]|nr:hypothetical protein KAM621c_54330 [Citrobacter braakii]
MHSVSGYYILSVSYNTDKGEHMDHVGIAKVWRQRNQEHADSGVVLIWDGEAYGWKNVLRDPQHERPGAIAVDAEGNMFIAEGGNDYDGAKCWVVFQES